MKNFLIIQTAFLGDLILTTAIIEKLHKFFPDSLIDIVIRKGNEIVLQNNPYINHIYIWDKKKDKHKNLFKIICQIRRKKYDYLINCHRYLSSGIISLFVRAKQKSGFKQNPLSFIYQRKVRHIIGNNLHEVDRNNMLIEYITDKERVLPRLYPSVDDYNNVEQYKNKGYICIVPGSVWYTKQLPAEKWIELISKLQSKYLIYLLGSEDDWRYCENLKKEASSKNTINLSGQLTLLESAALMREAVMNYMNDSAPLHIASAVNAPITAVFCSTVPEFGFYPLSDKAKIVQTNLALNCRPCHIHGLNACPEGHFKCGYGIEVKDMLF